MAVIGGLTVNMLVTRLLIPIGYQVLHSFGGRTALTARTKPVRSRRRARF